MERRTENTNNTQLERRTNKSKGLVKTADDMLKT